MDTPTRTTTQPSLHALVHALDDLLGVDARELQDLYCCARAPRLADVAGPLRGRMLAWPSIGGPPARLVRRLAAWNRFPWRGKTFWPEDGEAGSGINRVFSDRFELFRFRTYVDRSRAGDFDALQLDYDLPENPFFIRAIKDEIRELVPGLWLGQAYVQLAEPHLVLYFGLQSQR